MFVAFILMVFNQDANHRVRCYEAPWLPQSGWERFQLKEASERS